MNPAAIAIELTVLLLVFGFLVFGLLLICPTAFVSDYPPEIQEAYYRSQNKQAEKRTLNTMMAIKKMAVILVYMFIFAWMSHIAGAKTFAQGG